MTREEQIRQEMSKIAGTHPDWSKNDCMRMGFLEGAKWADENPNSNGKELLYVAQKTAERTKKETINNACKWLEDELFEDKQYFTDSNVKSVSYDTLDQFIENFKKAMNYETECVFL